MCLDDGEIPARRNDEGNDEEEDEGNITNDITETSVALRNTVRKELTKERGTAAPASSVGTSKGAAAVSVGSTREVSRKRKSSKVATVAEKRSRVVNIEELDRDDDTESRKNSDEFPAEERPPMFRNDHKFDRLDYQTAAKVCFEYSMMIEKRAMKSSAKNSLEKCDDKLVKVKIPEGEDDAFETLNIIARQKLRPVNKEIDAIMDWFPRERKEIIRNLPLGVYGLQDSVPTKSIEACHNLASVIELKMFSPRNLRTSATNQRNKAFTDRDGKLVVETADVYGELETAGDVVQAWNTLDCIWQKIHPEWPVAKIGLRSCLCTAGTRRGR